MKLRLLCFLSGFCLFVAGIYADTRTAASPSYVDVSDVVSAANSGDTVIVPSGSAIWSSALIITKGIILRGAGVDNTIITGNVGSDIFLVQYKPDNPLLNDAFRLTGFTFDLNNDSKALLLQNRTANVLNKIRVDHNSFLNCIAPTMQISGTVYGVMDNNTLSGSVHIDAYGANAISWDNLTFTYGTADNFYIEDNNITTNYTGHSGGVGGRYCARYNTYIHVADHGLYPWYDMHGNMGTGGNYSTMGAEIYGNIVIHYYTNAGVGIFDQRGGKALIFNNKVVTTLTCGAKAREEYDDFLNPTTNPQPQHVSDSYYWNNRYGSNLVTAYVQNSPGVAYPLTENVDFYNQNDYFNGTTGVGCGTLANRPGICTPGVAYWATDQSCSEVSDDNAGAHPTTPISGTLYKCTVTNTWIPYYTPFTYPHPLRTNDAAYEYIVNVFPNPCRVYQGENTITFFGDLSIGDNIRVFDMSGKTVHDSGNISETTYEWNVSEIASGMYPFVVKSADGETKASGKIALIR
ncbi:T9SS type A sorting domain-containing protein [candidate division WOR-3 bacterium]|nr:T9SS type A sorting domain-containing protein [candidate division WOR-3 bacterium]